MLKNLARIYLTGNNQAINDDLKKYLKTKNLEVINQEKDNSDYRLLVYDLGNENENLTATILDELGRTTPAKTCLILVAYSHQNQRPARPYYETVQPYLIDRKTNLRLIQTRDLYHHGTKAITSFEEYIVEAQNTQRINVTPGGSRKHYPTSTADLCDLIIKSLFITNTGGKTFVGLTEEISDLELAYLIKKTLEKTEKTLDINLSEKTANTDGIENQDSMTLSIQTQALLNWIPKTNFSDELTAILSYKQQKEGGEKPELKKLEPDIETKPLDLHQKEERGFLKIVMLGITSAVVLTAIPFAIFVSSLYISTTDTLQAFKEIQNGEVAKSQKKLRQGRFFQILAENTFQPIVPISRLINKSTTDSTNNYLLALGHGQALIGSIIDTYSLGNQLYLGLLGKQAAEPKTITAALRLNLLSISENLSQIQLIYGGIKLPFGLNKSLSHTDINQSINLLKSQISTALPLLNIIEKIGTNQGAQRYLIIVQDPNELRPTGGFITTYGVLTLDQGKIIDFNIDSSLTLDRLIEGKIEPPAVVKQLLGQQNWRFHDSNLDADFKISGEQIAWFYQRFKSVNIDGVIGTNTNLLRFILEQTGNVVLSDNQEVTPDSLPSLSSSLTASKGLDIITALTQTLGKKFISGEISFARFSRALLKAVSLHEITAWFSAPQQQSFAQTGQISGEAVVQSCHPQLSAHNCHADTVYLNESNMSVNKLNYYLKRSQNIIAEITQSGQVNYTLNYDYSYPVPAPTTQEGSYKAYYQLYLPTEGKDTTILLDAQELDPKTLIRSSQVGFIKTEFSAILAINQPHHLEIRFSSPNMLNLKKQFIPYTLAILKQPGTPNDSLTVKIRYPSNLVARNMTLPLMQTSANELVFQTGRVTQENIGVIFKNNSL